MQVVSIGYFEPINPSIKIEFVRIFSSSLRIFIVRDVCVFHAGIDCSLNIKLRANKLSCPVKTRIY